MNDIQYQLDYVVGSTSRLINMCDMVTSSPTYGCFNYSFWRDKTVDFPDSRFQEAGATLALAYYILKTGLVDQFDVDNEYLKQLYRGFSAGLNFLFKIQRGDGSLDEWYVGERGFAAVEFPLIAYAYVAKILGREHIQDDDWDTLLKFIIKSATWLSYRLDLIKSNHQAAASAALALAYEVTNDEKYLDAARFSHHSFLSRMTNEGWSPEIGAVDIGYSSVTLDYLAIYKNIDTEYASSECIEALAKFLYANVSPNYEINTLAGTCQNPYVSRIGVLLGSIWSSSSMKLLEYLSVSRGYQGIAPYLSDDLRLCRWGHLPLITYYHMKQNAIDINLVLSNSINSDTGVEICFLNEAGIINFKTKDCITSFTAKRPGSVYYQSNGRKSKIIMNGYVLHHRGKTYNDMSFDVSNTFNCDGGYHTQIKLKKSNYFRPSQFMRFVLRLACVTDITSRISRAIIDKIRLKTGSSLNQSSTSYALFGNDVFIIDRRIDYISEKRRIVVKDVFPSEITAVDCELYIDYLFAPQKRVVNTMGVFVHEYQL